MTYWTRLLFSLWAGIMLCGKECEGTLTEIKEQYPNRFTAGLNFSQIDLKMKMTDVKAKVNNTFSGIYIGYEYRKPENFYTLIDLSVSKSDRKSSIDTSYIDDHRSLHLDFGRSSVLFGYTKSSCNWLFTPYVGFGTFLICNHHTHQTKLYERLRTFTIGIRSDYSFNDHLDLGANFQLFNLCGIKEYRLKNLSGTHYLWRSYFESWGLSFKLPITYHYGETQQWDVQLEPYCTIISFRDSQLTYGANFLIGYNF